MCLSWLFTLSPSVPRLCPGPCSFSLETGFPRPLLATDSFPFSSPRNIFILLFLFEGHFPTPQTCRLAIMFLQLFKDVSCHLRVYGADGVAWGAVTCLWLLSIVPLGAASSLCSQARPQGPALPWDSAGLRDSPGRARDAGCQQGTIPVHILWLPGSVRAAEQSLPLPMVSPSLPAASSDCPMASLARPCCVLSTGSFSEALEEQQEDRTQHFPRSRCESCRIHVCRPGTPCCERLACQRPRSVSPCHCFSVSCCF